MEMMKLYKNNLTDKNVERNLPFCSSNKQVLLSRLHGCLVLGVNAIVAALLDNNDVALQSKRADNDIKTPSRADLAQGKSDIVNVDPYYPIKTIITSSK